MTTMVTAELSGLSRVPVLQSDGGNWTIFETRFRHFAKSKALWEHFTGTSSRPAAIAAQADIDAWQKREDEAHNYLAQRLEDTTLLLADEFNTVAEMWEWITNEFTALSSHVLASMQAEFDALTCGENGNVRAHLEQLQLRYKALVAVGVKLSDSQYATRIINSLPRYFQRYLATITSSAKAALMASNLARTAAAQAQAAGSVSTAPTSLTITSGNTAANHAVTLSPGYLMHLESPREDLGVALSAQGSQASLPQDTGNRNGGGNSWRGNGQRPNGVCWNCGGRGHFKSQCPSPKEGSSSASETANAAVSFDDIDGAWSVVPVDSVPDTVDRTLGSGWLRVAPETVFDMEEMEGNGPAPVLMSVCEPDSVSVANRREYLPDVPPALLDLEVSDGCDPRADFGPTEDDEHSDFEGSGSDMDSMPALEDISDSEAESGGEDSPESVFRATCNVGAIEMAIAVNTGGRSSAQTELHDSGLTQHLSPAEAVSSTPMSTSSDDELAEFADERLISKADALFSASGLPQHLWGECLRHVMWLEGCTPARVHTYITDTRTWGSQCYVHHPKSFARLSKRERRARIGRWMGLEENSGGHRVYWPAEQRISVEHTVIFPKRHVLDRIEGEYNIWPSPGHSRPNERLGNPNPITRESDDAPMPHFFPKSTPSSATPGTEIVADRGGEFASIHVASGISLSTANFVSASSTSTVKNIVGSLACSGMQCESDVTSATSSPSDTCSTAQTADFEPVGHFIKSFIDDFAFLKNSGPIWGQLTRTDKADGGGQEQDSDHMSDHDHDAFASRVPFAEDKHFAVADCVKYA